MLKIKLRNGGETTIDKEDLCRIEKYLIYKLGSGYATCRYKTEMKSLHRIILNAKPGQLVDHINGNKLDNRKSNLRFLNKAGNGLNAKIRTNNTSGIKGVAWNKSAKKWIVQIGNTKNGSYKYLGCFDDKTKAALVYTKEAEARLTQYTY